MKSLFAKNFFIYAMVIVLSFAILGSTFIYQVNHFAMAARFYGLPQGVYITAVDPSYDSYKQGLREGDIVTAVGDTAVQSVSEACAARNTHAAGDQVSLTVYRKGQYVKLTIKLGEQTDHSGSYNF